MFESIIANEKKRERNLFNQGKAEGMAKGRAEGIAIGEKAAQIKAAKKMLAKNEPISEIMEFTDLSEQEILDISKD